MTAHDTHYIADDDALAHLVDALRGTSWLAVDTEFTRERTYRPQLCLLQVATESLEACIDPLAVTSLAPIVEVLADPQTLKVMHAARQDIEVLYTRYGCLPAPLFDTQVAAALTGHGEQVSYRALVASLAGVQLDKAHTRSDWARRPLSRQQLDYAIADVHHLGTLYRQLRGDLAERGRLQWLEEETAALLDPLTYRADASLQSCRLRGVERLDPAGRTIADALVGWRERTAEALDLPRRQVLTDDALVAIARRRPSRPQQLERIKGLDERFATRHGEAVVAAVAQAQAGPTLPPPAPAREDALVDALMALVRSRAAEAEVPPGLLASRRSLERLAQGERALDVLGGWRYALVGRDLLRFAAGDATLALVDGQLQVQAAVDEPA